MKILGIDAATMTAGVAVVENGEVLGEIAIHSKVTHSKKLMVIIDQLLNNLELKVTDLDAIAVSTGPGSFTGVRIGIATALGLVRAGGLKLIGVSSMEGLAANATPFHGVVCPIQDARRDEVYTAIFRNSEPVTEDLAIHIDDLIVRLNEVGEDVLLIGPDAAKFFNRVSDALEQKVLLAEPQHLNPRASSIAIAAMGKKLADTVEPNYVRKSQAEVTYEKKHGKSLL
jgi:tRNA threonylcarbamoyl adenosine modification protein YeaZ